jgi:hypothetical protein
LASLLLGLSSQQRLVLGVDLVLEAAVYSSLLEVVVVASVAGVVAVAYVVAVAAAAAVGALFWLPFPLIA